MHYQCEHDDSENLEADYHDERQILGYRLAVLRKQTNKKYFKMQEK